MPIDLSQIKKKLQGPQDGQDVVRLRVGTISAINADGTVNVTISGIVVLNVPRLEGAELSVGEVVQMTSYRGSLMVLGGTAAGTTFRGELLDQDEIVADSATFNGAAETVLSTLTGTVVSGRSYELRFTGAVSSSVANDDHILRVREDNVSGTQLTGPQIRCHTTSTIGWFMTFFVQYVAGSSGSKSFVLTGRRNAGTGNGQLRASTARRNYFQLWRVD